MRAPRTVKGGARITIGRLLAAAIVVFPVAGTALTSTANLSEAVPPAPAYGDDAAWLCRPGRQDACAAPTKATIIDAAGSKRVETYTADPTASIDCFYVYPTVSWVPALYSPIHAGDDETQVVRRQLARFTTVCRPFAPLYRQVTLLGLLSAIRGERVIDWDLSYGDVLAAWKAYVANDNRGRGVVLIGHSQGSRHLARLIANEIDGKPIAARLVSAIIPGTSIDVPPGKDVGGSFRHVPLCRAADQTGCVIAYASYPADRKISETARFGFTKTAGMRNACVDPAALNGAKNLDAALPLTPELRLRFATDFAVLPGLVSASCRDEGRFSVLAIEVRREDRTGEPAVSMIDRLGEYNALHGLHPLDLNLALGTLVDLVRKETAAYLRH